MQMVYTMTPVERGNILAALGEATAVLQIDLPAQPHHAAVSPSVRHDVVEQVESQLYWRRRGECIGTPRSTAKAYGVTEDEAEDVLEHVAATGKIYRSSKNGWYYRAS